MPRKRDRPTPAACTSGGRFPWSPIDTGTPDERGAAHQQAVIAQWVVQAMTQQKVSQRDLERAGVASQSTISGLLTGRAWTDMWVVARVVTFLGGELGVRNARR